MRNTVDMAWATVLNMAYKVGSWVTANGRGLAGGPVGAPSRILSPINRVAPGPVTHPGPSRKLGAATTPSGRAEQPATRRAEPVRGDLAIWLALLGVGVLAIGLRAVNLGQSWEVFIDEVTYWRLGQNVHTGQGVVLYGKLFFLHPPLFFLIEAFYLSIVVPGGLIIDQVHVLRYLNVIVAGLSTGLVFLIGRQMAGWRGGLLAALVYALDPFTIRITSRVLIEPSAVLWVLAGYALLFSAGPTGLRDGIGWRQVAAGVAFGLALLSKEMSSFVTLLPLGLTFVLGWYLSRRASFAVGLTAVLTYLPYPLIVTLAGDGGIFAEQKFRGLLRLAGVIKETGFKRPGGPSFVEAIMANLGQFADTYAIIALGGLAILYLAWRAEGAARMLALWAAGAYLMMTYSLVFGTLEEQFFYFLVVPAILATVVAASLLLREPGLRGATRRAVVHATTGLVALFVVWSLGVWSYVHFTPDNGYARALAYLRQSVPRGTVVAITSEPGQFLLEGYRVGYWASPEQLSASNAEYVVLNTKIIRNGYSLVEPRLVQQVESVGTPVFSFIGRDSGPLYIYKLPPNF